MVRVDPQAQLTQWVRHIHQQRCLLRERPESQHRREALIHLNARMSALVEICKLLRRAGLADLSTALPRARIKDG